MAMLESSSGKAGHGNGDDIFLMATGQKQGKLVGEIQEDKHKGSIQVIEWSWGAESPRDHATGLATGRRFYSHLKVLKRIDSTTPLFLQALSTNETLTQLLLTLRRPGGATAVEYLKIAMTNAGVAKHEWLPPANGQSWEHEWVSFTFQKYDMTYTGAKVDGSKRASITTSDDWSFTA
jgi:type VI secretion system secreted protein Hcp